MHRGSRTQKQQWLIYTLALKLLKLNLFSSRWTYYGLQFMTTKFKSLDYTNKWCLFFFIVFYFFLIRLLTLIKVLSVGKWEQWDKLSHQGQENSSMDWICSFCWAKRISLCLLLLTGALFMLGQHYVYAWPF